MIRDVDSSAVISAHVIESPVLGAITPKELFGGVKVLILMLKDDSFVYNMSNCGNNCAKWILKIAENSNENMTEEEKKRDENYAQQNTETDQDAIAENQDREVLKFVDVFGNEYETEINPNIEKHSYDLSKFVREGDKLSYNDESFYARLGVDVSHHQGNISLDGEFENNVEGAKKAGLEVGVYFFAQAVNEAEAIEEAEFVLAHLSAYHITLPVVYDPESILDDVARTDHVTGEQFTENTVAFCNRVKESGYEPMVYANMLWEAYNLKLEDLSDYPIWYADYELLPQTPYNFKYWQYTNEGRVDGISGNVDINIQMIEK